MKRFKALLVSVALALGVVVAVPQPAWAATDGVEINAENFPDETFRSYVNKNFNTNGDDVLSSTELAAVTEINVYEKDISDLTGIEHFTALTSLDCTYNLLTSLDVSKNVLLTDLSCYNNQLTSLDVSKNVALTYLNCCDNLLTSLDVSKNTSLVYLNCGYNPLNSLNVSNNSSLEDLMCYDCNLASLDVSHNASLETLTCYNNQLTSLITGSISKLYWLDCKYNQLTSLDLRANTSLRTVSCYNNKLTKLDVSGLSSLSGVLCYNNQLTTLDVSGCDINMANSSFYGNPLEQITGLSFFPDVAKEGYYLVGWYDNDGFTGNPVSNPDGSKTYYAKWEQYVAKVTNSSGSVTYYETVSEALAAATSGSAVEALVNDTVEGNATLASGASLTIAEDVTLTVANLVNNGSVLLEDGSKLVVSGTLTGSGSIDGHEEGTNTYVPHSWNATTGICTVSGCGKYQPAMYNATDDVYEISNAGQLAWFSALVNGDSTHATFSTQNMFANGKLMANIDLSSVCGESVGNWVPIGDYDKIGDYDNDEDDIYNEYKGKFDGNGKSITGLYFSYGSNNISCMGLFGRASGAKIKNLDVSGTVSYHVNADGGSGRLGAIVGWALDDTVIDSCSSSTNILGNATWAGGIVGTCAGSIVSACSVGASVRVEGVGYSDGGIYGGVGGICGRTYENAAIKDCFVYGVNVSSTYGQGGGIVGYLTSGTLVSNCYYDKDSFADAIGYNGGTSIHVEGKTQAEFASGEVCWLLNSNDSVDAAVWGQAVGTDSYPYFVSDAHPAVEKFTVAFDANETGITAPDAQYVYTGGTATEPDAIESDGKVVFWYTEAACTTKYDFSAEVTADLTLYAKLVDCEASVTSGSDIKKYDTLANALAAAKDGDTVTLLRDVEVRNGPEISKSITFDLGGKKLAMTGLGEWLTVKNVNGSGSGVTIKNGTITACAAMGIVEAVNSNLTIVDGVTLDGTKDSSDGLHVGENSTVTVQGGTISGLYDGVYMTGGVLRVMGGTITGKNRYGIRVDGGDLKFEGGTVDGENCGINIETMADSVSICGGNVSSVDVEDDARQFISAQLNADGSIKSRPHFSTAPSSAYLADGYTLTTDSTAGYANTIAFDFSKATVTLASSSLTYNGKAQEPEVTVELNGKTLTAGTDYTVSYSNNKDASEEAKVVVTGKGDYVGSVEKTFTISPKALTSADLEYTGEALTKVYDETTDCTLTEVSVKDGVLAAGETLEVTGTAAYDSADAGTRTVTFTPGGIATGNYRLASTTTLEIPATITAKKEATPEAAIDYEDGLLTGLERDVTYLVNGVEYKADVNGDIDILEDWMTGSATTIVRKARNSNYGDSETQSLTIPKRPGELGLSISNEDEGVVLSSAYCYSSDYDPDGEAGNGTWKVGDGSLVSVEPGATLYVYQLPTNSSFESDLNKLTAPARATKPSVSIDYEAETLSTAEGMEYETLDADVWADCSASMEITALISDWDGTNARDVKLRTKATEGAGGTYASETVTVNIPARPAMPEGWHGVNESVAETNDGKIVGLHTNTTYQYRTGSNEPWSTWKSDANGEITGLADGSYEFRRAAIAGEQFASAIEDVAIGIGKDRVCVLNVDSVGFGNGVVFGYAEAPDAMAVSIANGGNVEATIVSVAVSDTSAFTVVVPETGSASVAAGEVSTVWKIQPVTGLAAGDHKATVTVTYKDAGVAGAETKTATAEVKLTVHKAQDSLAFASSVAEGYVYSEGGTFSLDVVGSGDGAVTYVSSDSGVVSISGATASILKAGTVEITATRAASANYHGATATLTVTVSKATPTAKAPDVAEATYGQKLSEIALTNPDGNTAGNWSWADGSLSVGDVGVHTFRAVFTPDASDCYDTAEADVSVTVGRASSSISAPTVASSTPSSVKLAAVAPTAGDGTVEYGYSTSNDASKVESWQEGTGFSGLSASTTYYFFARVAESSSYEAATSSGTPFTTSEKIKLSISVEPLGAIYDGEAHVGYSSIGAKAGDVAVDGIGWVLTYATSAGEVLDGAPKNVGSYALAVSVPGSNADYQGSATVQFTISAKQVTITGLGAASKVYNGSADAAVTGTAVIDGKVEDDVLEVVSGTAAFSDANVGTGKTVTFAGYALSGDDAGNYTLSAQPASVKASIKAATPAIKWEDASQTVAYTGEAAEVGAPTVTLVNGETFDGTISYSYRANDGTGEYASGLPTDVGTYSVRASIAAAGNYAAAETSNDMTLTIGAASMGTVGVADVSVTYDGAAHSISVSAPEGAKVTYSTDGVNFGETNPSYVDAQEATTVYYKVEKANYVTVTGSATVEIKPKDIEPTVTAASLVYTGEQLKPDVVVKDGGTELAASDYELVYGENVNAGAGAGSVTVKDKDGGNYSFSDATASFDILKASYTGTIAENDYVNVNTLDAHGKTYTYDFTQAISHLAGAKVKDVSIDANDDGVLDASQAPSFDGNVVTFYVGTVTDADKKGVLNVTIESTNYEDIIAELDVVTKHRDDADVSIAGIPETVAYGDADFELTAQAANAGTGTGTWTWSSSDESVLTVKQDAEDGSKATVHVVKADPAGAIITATYASETTLGDLKETVAVHKRQVTITGLGAASKVYDGSAAAEVTGTATVDDMVAGDDLAVTAGTASFADANAGEGKTVTFSGYGLEGAAASNYTLKAQPASVKADILAKVIGLEWSGTDGLVYGKPVNVAAAATGLVDGDSCSVTVAGGTEGSAGEHTATATALSNGNYALPEDVSVTYTVAKAAPTAGDFVFTAPAELAYDGKAKVAAVVVAEGVEGMGEVSVSYYDASGATVAAPTNVGSYTVEVNVAAGESYEAASGLSDAKWAFSIVASGAAVEAAPTANTLTYTAEPQELVSAGEASGGTMVYSLAEDGDYGESIPTSTNAGSYIVYYKVVGDANHSDSEVASVPVSVAWAKVTITAPSKSIYAGESAPELASDDCVIEGLVGADELVAEPTLAYAETPDTSKAGTVVIKASGADAGANYEIEYVDGLLTIEARPSSGGSSTPEPEPATNPVTVPTTTEGGAVTVSPTTAKAGDTVTVTAEPEVGHEVEKVTVVDASGNEVAVAVGEDGTYSFTMPEGKVSVEVSFKVKTYKDVDYSSWYAPGVTTVSEVGLMGGYGDSNVFGVGKPMTRAEFAQILYRASGGNTSAAYPANETGMGDVESNAWYTAAANWAVANGVIEGYDLASGRKFGPNDPVTFEQAVKILARYCDLEGSASHATGSLAKFADAGDVSSWAAPYVAWAVDNGLVEGHNGTTLAPAEHVARERAATVIARAIEKGLLTVK